MTQWGGSHVWKVGGKVFAIGGWNGDGVGTTFKVSGVAFEILKDMPGLRPAPYLASRGMSWIQHYVPPSLPDDELLERIRASYTLVASKLPRTAKGSPV